MGKTTKLVALALRTGAYLVVMNMSEIARIQRNFSPVPKMITFNEFINRSYFDKGISSFIIDNADLLLQQMSAVSITVISTTYSEGG